MTAVSSLELIKDRLLSILSELHDVDFESTLLDLKLELISSLSDVYFIVRGTKTSISISSTTEAWKDCINYLKALVKQL